MEHRYRCSWEKIYMGWKSPLGKCFLTWWMVSEDQYCISCGAMLFLIFLLQLEIHFTSFASCILERVQLQVVNHDLAIVTLSKKKKKILWYNFSSKCLKDAGQKLPSASGISVEYNIDAIILYFSTPVHKVNTAVICHKRFLGEQMQDSSL